MSKAKSKLKKKQSNSQSHKTTAQKLPFMEHVYELRKRVVYVAMSVALFSVLAYTVEHRIVAALLEPAQGQKFIYTSPGGGIDFLFRVCLYVGVAISIPVIVYQALRYIEPLIKKGSMRFIILGSIASGILGLIGITFGYFIGLPSALHFLLHQFQTTQIQPLLTIQSYMSFVTLYLFGCALLFQVPLTMIFINRIKPLQPKKLLKMERWVILLSVVSGGIINPSPAIKDQVMLAGPIILMYQVGIIIIWRLNRRNTKPAHVAALLRKDEELRAARQEQFRVAQEALLRARVKQTPVLSQQRAPTPTPVSIPKIAAPPVATPTRITRPPRPNTRTRRYFNDFTRRSYNDTAAPRISGIENAA
jgi:sec-independent protein translocase protein TatC